jgi:quinol monooxygenase YgiN
MTCMRRKSWIAVVALLLAVGARSVMSQDRTIGRYADLPAGAYAVVAEVRAKPGQEQALRQATLPLVAAVRREPNNLLYFLHEDREVPGRFVFYEIFATHADFEAHNATPHVQAWFAKLPKLADGGVKVVRMQVLGNRPMPMPQ